MLRDPVVRQRHDGGRLAVHVGKHRQRHDVALSAGQLPGFAGVTNPTSEMMPFGW